MKQQDARSQRRKNYDGTGFQRRKVLSKELDISTPYGLMTLTVSRNKDGSLRSFVLNFSAGRLTWQDSGHWGLGNWKGMLMEPGTIFPDSEEYVCIQNHDDPAVLGICEIIEDLRSRPVPVRRKETAREWDLRPFLARMVEERRIDFFRKALELIDTIPANVKSEYGESWILGSRKFTVDVINGDVQPELTDECPLYLFIQLTEGNRQHFVNSLKAFAVGFS